MNKIACITGATAGIGKASAVAFAQKGFDLIITGRRKERLIELEQELRNEYKVNVLSLNFDIRSKQEVEKHLNSMPNEWKSIDVLVNNAGGAHGKEPIFEGDFEDWDTMIDANIKGLLYVSRTIIPWMKERKSGHVINICSIAGKEAYAGGAVYCASKAAVDSLSKGMRIDCVAYGIKVTNICPGAVETEFSMVRFKGDKTKAEATYQGFKPLSSQDIAQTILYCAMLPEHVCINDLVIMPTAQANATTFHRG